MRAAVADGITGETINIGSGFEITIGDTAAMIAEALDADVNIVTDAERMRPATSEVERLYANAGKAERLMGWTPRYGGRDGFRRGIAETVAWFADPANRNRYKHDRYNI